MQVLLLELRGALRRQLHELRKDRKWNMFAWHAALAIPLVYY